MVLLMLGLVVIYSISPGLSVQRHVSENYYVTKQLIAVGLGAVTFAIMATVPISWWKKMSRPLIVVAVLATVVALVLPINPDYPAHRWIRLGGGLSFQSVELIKFAIIFVLSGFLADRISRREMASTHMTLKPIAIALLVIGFVVAGLQSDLGSTGVMVVMIGVMAFVAGLPLKRIALIGIAVVILVTMAISTTAYRRERFLTFMQPQRDCQSTGYQACQALIAVGSGGLFGKGIGESVQAYGYLPEAANDSIFAIYAEKFGFVGVTVLLALFMAFFARIKSVIERAPDDYHRLIVVGILAWLTTQAFINIGAMVGLLPLKGITLPLISYGGTSIIFVTAAVGLVFNISRYTTFAPRADEQERRSNDYSTDRRRNGRPHYAYPSRRS